MGIFSKKRSEPAVDASQTIASPDELVRAYLRGQNLEQIGNVDGAIELYEHAVAAGFDASGPYDRLLTIYEQRRQHVDVIRIAQASLKSIRTYPAKRMFYQEFLERAQKALSSSLND